MLNIFTKHIAAKPVLPHFEFAAILLLHALQKLGQTEACLVLADQMLEQEPNNLELLDPRYTCGFVIAPALEVYPLKPIELIVVARAW